MSDAQPKNTLVSGKKAVRPSSSRINMSVFIIYDMVMMRVISYYREECSFLHFAVKLHPAMCRPLS